MPREKERHGEMTGPLSGTIEKWAWEIPSSSGGWSPAEAMLGPLSSANTCVSGLLLSDAAGVRLQTPPACDPEVEHEPPATRPCSSCRPGRADRRAARAS